jgi:PHD/YefM family antitoxin component YafN of YafNO toxin-antitoxin module
MSGIQFVIDDKGAKSAVIIDLNKYADVWEDFYDTLIAHQRANEPRESLHSVKKRLRRAGKLNG